MLGRLPIWMMPLIVLGGRALGQAGPEVPVEARQSLLMSGDCQLAGDPEQAAWRSPTLPMVCMRGGVGGEVRFFSGSPEENFWVRYGRIAAGLHAGEWMSLHGAARAVTTIPLGTKVTGHDARDTEYLALQVGNPAVHRFRVTAGRIPLPFGVNQAVLSDGARLYENPGFWSSPRYGAWVTADDRQALMLEAGAAGDPPAKKSLSTEAAGAPEDRVDPRRAVAARFSLDIAALEGTRLLLSAYGEDEGVRRFGFGLMTRSGQNDQTQFEVVRRLVIGDDRSGPFQQLIRLAYSGAYRGDTRWVAQFDDERLIHRMGTVGMDARVWDHLIFRIGVSYRKSESGDGLRRWSVASGLEAVL